MLLEGRRLRGDLSKVLQWVRRLNKGDVKKKCQNAKQRYKLDNFTANPVILPRSLFV